MFRAYAYSSGIDFGSNMGHSPIFPEGIETHLSDETLISKHYKFRSLSQARKKAMSIRPEGDKHLQYAKFTSDESWYIIPESSLTLRVDGEDWNYDVNYFGGRLNKDELKDYLGLKTIEDVEMWLKKRSLKK